MKYLLILLVSSATLVSAKPNIYTYIKTCKRNDPKLNECIKNSIYDLANKMITGINELGVGTLDPMHFDKLILDLGLGFKAENRDLKLKGVKNLKIDDFIADIEANTFSYKISIPELIASATYEIDAAIGPIPLKGKGPMNFTAQSITCRGKFHGTKVLRGEKTWYYFSSMDMKMAIGDYQIKLDNLFEGDSVIGEVTNRLLNEEKTEVLASLLPGIEKLVVENILLLANSVIKHFTWDELFPIS